ncbi:MCE family protein [Nocardioides sp. NPDC051685]|uniref:MCE family protein n=1 Tax=Nocardioides sp. NPDC051685 TaxID=3364334 RepID=UPI0037B94DFB
MRLNTVPLIKVLAFVGTMSLLIAAVGVVFGRVRIGASNEFKAIFENASGLRGGSDVRGNGVAIGSVKEVEVGKGHTALVTFIVEDSVDLTEATTARIRYANLTGDRYLDLEPGTSQNAAPLDEGATIPLTMTQAALDLDEFFAGFDPLMRGLDPQEMNDLAENIIAVTQGQAGSVEAMLSDVASFTGRLAERDEIIGDTITNLSKALAVMDSHRAEFDELLVGLARLMDGFAKDRVVIGSSLASVSTAAAQTEDLLRRTRPGVKANVDQIGKLAGDINANADDIRDVLDTYPEFGRELARLGAYGAFYNFYLCGVKVKIDVPGEDLDVYTPWVVDNTGRCGGKQR